MTELSDEALDIVFRAARTHRAFTAEPVSDELLRRIFDLAKLGPTGGNVSPFRVVFVRSPEAKARLLPALASGNVEKTMSAPVTAIFAHDLQFFEHLPRLAPHMKSNPYASDPVAAEAAARMNGTLQAAYFMLAARSLGVDCGPMGGFDNAKVDAEFFAGSSWRSNFLCNLGHGDASKLFPRAPRLDFDEACKIL